MLFPGTSTGGPKNSFRREKITNKNNADAYFLFVQVQFGKADAPPKLQGIWGVAAPQFAGWSGGAAALPEFYFFRKLQP